MKKFFAAVLMAALIITITCVPICAEDVESTIGTEAEEMTEVLTEEITEEVAEEITEADEHTEEVTEADEEESEETETDKVDGAIVKQDYLSRMIEKIRGWIDANPETVGNLTAGGGVVLAAFIETRFSKKSRKKMEKATGEMNERTVILNNNAVELAETTKSAVNETKTTIVKALGEAVIEIKKLGETIVEELRANRRETRANSYLMAEMIKDARLAVKRKEEVIGEYEKIREGEASDDSNNEA